MPYFPEGPPAPPIAEAADFKAFVEAYRSSVPCLSNFVYLNHASVGPLSSWVEDAVNVALIHQRMEHSVTQDDWFDWWRYSRQRVGELLGASKDEVCIQTSTAGGLFRAFNALPLEAGDEVLVPADEFPSLYYALSEFRSRGCQVLEVQSSQGDGIVRTDDLLNAMTGSTKLVATSWVAFLHGYVHDLKELGKACRERNAWFVVDAIQGLGQLTIDVKETGAHFVSSQGAKWLCAPLGSGFLYASSDLPKGITPKQQGWFGLELNHEAYTDHTVQPKQNANRFGMGTVPLPSAYGLRRACEVILEAGPQRCEERAIACADRIHRAADAAGIAVYSDRGQRRCAIITLEMATKPGLPKLLDKAKVVYSLREGKLRLSPHWYTLDSEIDIVCEILAAKQ